VSDTPPRRAGSAERFAARAMSIVDEALATTATKNERGLAKARIAICGMFAVRQVVLNGAEIRAVLPKDTIILVALVVAIAASAFYLLKTASMSLGRWQLTFAVVDVVLFLLSTFPVVAWPEADYAGVLMTPFAGAGVLICVGAGLRLHRGYAALTATTTLLAFFVLCAVDKAVWGSRVAWDAGELVFYAIEIGAAGIVAVLVADRTLDLAARSAEKAIEAERARERFGAYVGREVAEEALRVDQIVMGGVRQPVAVLFSDLRGFTTYSERLAPEQLVTQLNAYLEEMVAVITRHGGVVDKYIGDGIMAVFGAPRSKGDDARRALFAARDMQRALLAHNARRVAAELSPLKMGVGVHYGPVVAGNVGTLDHAQYTIIGDVVNLASRLESATKDHGCDVLVSKDVVDAAGVGSDSVVARGSISVKGREQQIEVFSLVA
jgi:class 3 adenylate cyclase